MTSTHGDIEEKLEMIFSDDEEETQELIDREKDQQRRTEILDHFDIEPVPCKILNPLREKRRTDNLAVSIARLLSCINVTMLIIGILAIVMAIIRGKFGKSS